MQMVEVRSQGLKHEFKVILEGRDIALRIEKRLLEISKTLHVPGFRRGKVPIALLRKRYGSIIRAEVIELSIRESTAQVLKQYNLRPALVPQIRAAAGGISEEGDIAFTLIVEVLPDIPDINWSQLFVERPYANIDDQAISNLLERMLTTTRPIELARSGNIVIIDISSTINNIARPDLTRTNFPLELGAEQIIPGFDAAIIGTKVNDTRTFSLEIPVFLNVENNELIVGKTATFVVTIKAILEKILASENELFEYYRTNNPDELRSNIIQELKQLYAMQSHNCLKKNLLAKLSEDYTFEVPEGMVEIELSTILGQAMQEESSILGLRELAMDKESLKKWYCHVAENRIRLGLILSEISRIYDINIAQQDIEHTLISRASSIAGTIYSNALQSQFKRRILEHYLCQRSQTFDTFRASVLEEKVIDFILSRITVTERLVTAEELLAPNQES